MRIDFTPSPELYPFESRWHDSTAGRVHYVDEGQGRPLVFFHGNPTWSFLYRQIIAQLRDDYRCIALDYPGFGLSDRPQSNYGYTPDEHAAIASDLIATLDLNDAIFVGQDWGGPIGLATALNHQSRVSGLVFGNTWFWPTDHLLATGFGWLMSTRVLQRQIIDNNLFVERLLPIGTSRHLSAAEMDHYRAVQPTAAARIGVAEFPRQLRAAREFLGRLAVQVPDKLGDRRTLLTWGERDPVFPASRTVPRWRATFADHVYVPLPKAKHFIQEDAPDDIADAIRDRFPT